MDKALQADDVQNQIAAETLRLLRTVNALAEDPSFQKLLARVLSLADAMFIPESGAGNLALLATLLDRNKGNVSKMIAREGIPTHKPTSDRIVNFADVMSGTRDAQVQ